MQPTQQEHTKLRTGDDDLVLRRQDVEGTQGVRASLRQQQRSGRGRWVRKVRTACAFWPQRSGGRWNDDSQHLVQRLVALRARRAPATLRGAASQGWARRWWGVSAVAAQRAACSAVLGIWTMPPWPNWRRFCISQPTRRPAGCRCVRASELLQLWKPGSFLSPPAS